MRKYLLLLMFLCLASLLHSQNKFELVSPNGEIKVLFNLSDKIYYSIDYNGEVLLKDNSIQLTLKNQVLGQNPKLRRQKRMSIDEYLTPVVPLKYSKINNRYNNRHAYSHERCCPYKRRYFQAPCQYLLQRKK